MRTSNFSENGLSRNDVTCTTCNVPAMLVVEQLVWCHCIYNKVVLLPEQEHNSRHGIDRFRNGSNRAHATNVESGFGTIALGVDLTRKEKAELPLLAGKAVDWVPQEHRRNNDDDGKNYNHLVNVMDEPVLMQIVNKIHKRAGQEIKIQ